MRKQHHVGGKDLSSFGSQILSIDWWWRLSGKGKNSLSLFFWLSVFSLDSFVTSTKGGLDDSLPSVSLLITTQSPGTRCLRISAQGERNLNPVLQMHLVHVCFSSLPRLQPGRQSTDYNVPKSSDDELMINKCKLQFHLSMVLGWFFLFLRDWLPPKLVRSVGSSAGVSHFCWILFWIDFLNCW